MTTITLEKPITTNTIKVKTVADTLIKSDDKPEIKTTWIKDQSPDWLKKPKKVKSKAL